MKPGLSEQSTPLLGEDSVNHCEQLLKSHIGKNRKPRIVNPEDFTTTEELFDEIRTWWTQRYRKDEGSWISYQNKLEAMINHEIYPIDVFDLNPDQIIAHLDYVEEQVKEQQETDHDNSGIYRVISRWKAIKALMRAYGRIEEIPNWNYTPPPAPKAKLKIIPSPSTVHKIIHHKYSKDRFETKLYQYI